MSLTRSNTGILAVAIAGSSDPFITEIDRSGSVQVAWTGLDGSDGVITVECSNFGTTGTWELVKSTATRTLDTTDGSQLFIISPVSMEYVRVTYDPGSNTTGNILFLWKDMR